MKALFLVKHPGALRLLESTLRLLAERGHTVHLAFETAGTAEAQRLAQRLADECPGLTVGRAVKAPRTAVPVLARRIRLGLDYLRYLEPRYAGSPKLRARAEAQAPALVRRLAPRIGPARLAAVLARIERRLPPPERIVRFVRDHDPDLVLATPLVGMGASQADFLRAARRLGIRTAFPVLSWDNLTNKGLLRDAPDRVLVWNEAQAREAVELHGVPPKCVAVTGAAAFDHWFDWSVSRTREELCAEVGLRADRPFVLYLCSSPFIAEDETRFVTSWLQRLREVGGPLAETGVLVRPHPQNAAHWHGFSAGDQVAVWPPAGEDPLDDAARRNYYDSIYHSAAVVGINTTALIESAILAKPVLTLLEDRYRDTQEGTLHFHHLAGESGLLHVARSFEEHAALLRQAVDGTLAVDNERFLGSFVRPRGLDLPATPFVVEALEQAAKRARPPASDRPQPAEEAAAAIVRVARDGGPVLAGPWLAEVGHELLYWIPFLRWAGERNPGLADRLVAVSRGGVSDWYADACRGGYVELYDLIEPEELQRLLAERGARKQMGGAGLDEDLAARAAEAAGLPDAVVLHPSAMFAAYWRLLKERGVHRHGGMFDLRPLARPPLPVALEERLPERFVATRFYANASFPDTAENRAAGAAVLESVAATADVVALDPGLQLDDHRDLELVRPVVRLDDLMAPATNLAVQTAVLARAEAYVGTYGGLSYLAPLLGIPSVALYSDPARFRPHHLELAQRAFREPPFGRLVALDVRELELVRLVAAALVAS